MRGKAKRSPPGACKTQGFLDHSSPILSQVDGSSAVLTRASMWGSSYPLWNASAQNKGGV